MFFASESDKTPVRKWQMGDIRVVKLDKPKHVHIDVDGADATNLHFHAGSKDTAEAIMTKLQSSRALAVEAAGPATNGTAPSPPPAAAEPIERPRSSAQKSVHFAQDEPDVIPPSETYGEEEEVEEEEEEVQPVHAVAESEDGPAAAVLYDFTADGDDELTVAEGEILIVLERDSEEWWKCRNAHGAEGVVPASYVEVSLNSRRALVVNSRRFAALGRRCCSAFWSFRRFSRSSRGRRCRCRCCREGSAGSG